MKMSKEIEEFLCMAKRLLEFGFSIDTIMDQFVKKMNKLGIKNE